MIQTLVRVSLPPGLDRAYSFREAELLSYGLNLIPVSMAKKYADSYAPIQPYMIPMKVLCADWDYTKIKEAYGLDEIRILSGDRLVTRFAGVREGKAYRVEIPAGEREPFQRRKAVRSLVWQQQYLLSWGEDERVFEFFRVESGRKLKPMQFFPITGQILTDWNVIFPADPIPLEEPTRRSGLFYYFT